MSKHAVLACALVAVLGMPLALRADPPGRPKPLTPAQYRCLAQLERQPEHAAVQDVQATYTSSKKFDKAFTRASDDFWTLAYQLGLPATILTMLIAAGAL